VARRGGLGKGLGALIPTGPGAEAAGGLREIDTASIRPNPYQPRERFDEELLNELTESIREVGILQPVLVRPVGDEFELIAGERRWRAAREAGLAALPAIVREADDREALLLALVENVARENLSPVEEARAYAALIDEFELSLGDLAERVGRSKPGVSNRLRLLDLPEEVLWMLARGELTEGHARAVLAVPDDETRLRLARRVVRDGMTVRATERAAQEGGARRRSRSSPVDPALAERARAAAERLTGLPSRVSAGKLELHFGDETGLEELVEALEAL
jgi:ParB family chromosome partitioning protein